MRKKFLVCCAVVFLVLQCVVACSAPTSDPTPTQDSSVPTTTSAKVEPIVIKAVTPLPTNNFNVDWLHMWVEKVKKESNGELEIDWLGGPEVIANFDQWEAMMNGVVDILPFFPFGYTISYVPVGNAAGLTKLTAWEEREVGAYDLWDEIYQTQGGCKYLGRSNAGPNLPFNFYLNEKVENIDDFEGLVFRVMPLYTPFIESLGASAVVIDLTECYSAMERGVIDGFIQSPGISSWGLHEVTKYRVEPGIYTNEAGVFMNLDTWNGLPQHLKDVLNDTMADYEYISVALYTLAVQREQQMCEAYGMEVIKLPSDEAARFEELCYDRTWEKVIQDDPEYAPKLRELTSSKE